ncbi:GntR family transcriptional regulator [Actinomycetes bacterium KLBMP 9759]
MSTPPYRRIADEIGHRIISGELRPGDRVPSARQIMRTWDVALATASRVLRELRDDGLVESRTGSGTVVRGTPTRRSVGSPGALLSRDRIVAAAVQIADAEGADELSMRRLAELLGVGPMSLYRHVAGKDELIYYMIQFVTRDYPLPDPPPDGWRARLTAVSRLQWRMYVEHPWLLEVHTVTRPLVDLAGLTHSEWTLEALSELDIDPADRVREVIALPALVQGLASVMAVEQAAIRASGLSNAEWWALSEREIGRHMAGGHFPNLSRVTVNPFIDLDALFELGLRRHLDGIEAEAHRRGR